MTSLLDDFQAAVARYRDRVAIVEGTGAEITFAQLSERVDNYTRAWQSKITAGDRVLLAMGVGADLYASLAALWRLGATVVLPEPAMGLAGLRHAARSTRPTAFCCAGPYRILGYVLPELWRLPHLVPQSASGTPDRVPPQNPDATALISFTSGTTGAPKAIPRSHAFLAAQHRAIAPVLESIQAERDLVAFPVFVLINIASGRTSVLPNWKMSRLDRVTPTDLCQWIERQSVTRALLPPALCGTLGQGALPQGLHTLFTGGGPVFPDLFKVLMPLDTVTAVYGSTEAEPISHLNASEIKPQDWHLMADGGGLLVGAPVKDISVRIVNQEIWVSGDHVNQGYLDPAHDLENKVQQGGQIWHKTGDAGRFDAEGRLWLLGRIGTDVMIGGRQVFPFAIEVAARDWKGVKHVALLAVSNQPVLAIQGDTANLCTWQTKARALGIETVKPVSKMPMDRRHASKIDRAALIRLVQ